MKELRKLLAAVLMVLMLLSLCACGDNADQDTVDADTADGEYSEETDFIAVYEGAWQWSDGARVIEIGEDGSWSISDAEGFILDFGTVTDCSGTGIAFASDYLGDSFVLTVAGGYCLTDSSGAVLTEVDESEDYYGDFYDYYEDDLYDDDYSDDDYYEDEPMTGDDYIEDDPIGEGAYISPLEGIWYRSDNAQSSIRILEDGKWSAYEGETELSYGYVFPKVYSSDSYIAYIWGSDETLDVKVTDDNALVWDGAVFEMAE